LIGSEAVPLPGVSPAVLILVVLALGFAVLNGYNDSGSMVATVISTGACGARRALILAATANFIGPFLVGGAVTATISNSIVYPNAITLASLGATLLAAIAWNIFATSLGIPTSSSQALLGGLIGGGVAAGGFGVIQLRGALILLLALGAAPFLAGILGWLALRLTFWLVRGASPKINRSFRNGQLVTSVLLAISHGSSDVSKTVGILVLILGRAGLLRGTSVPIWIVFLASLTMSGAIALGGWRVIRTLGARIYKLRPVHGFLSQSIAAALVFGATLIGGPVSMGQIATSTLIGVGASERLSKVHWQTARRLALAWLFTLPVTAAIAFVLYQLTRFVFTG